MHKNKNMGIAEAAVKAHSAVAVAQGFYHDARGIIGFEEDAADLQEIHDRKWNKDMSVKDKIILGNINDIKVAHEEFFDFTTEVVEEFKSAAETNEPLSKERLEEMACYLHKQVIEEHDRAADFHELTMMRSLDFLTQNLERLFFFFELDNLKLFFSVRRKCTTRMHSTFDS